MSALGRYFRESGKKVLGYDRSETGLTKILGEEGIAVTTDSNPLHLPEEFRDESNRETTLVICTPAVPSDNKLISYFRQGNYEIHKRSDILAAIFNSGKGIAVAGTHGKTTVSTMAAHLLKQSSVGCSAFLGGISVNYDTNMLKSEGSELVVAEADEYDRSFLKLSPHIAVITSVDADHLDIYRDYSDLVSSFENFAGRVNEGGTLLVRKDVREKLNMPGNPRILVYSLRGEADFYASGLQITDEGRYSFDLLTPVGAVEGLLTGVPGLLNAENFVAAAAIALMSGVNPDELKRGMESYKGVKRRFEVRVRDSRMVYIDDYAHHPEEIKACILSVREMFPGKKITGVFQPHLYSRTRDFAGEFAGSLGMLDSLIMTEIYPAREDPIEGVSSYMIFEKVSAGSKKFCSYEDLPGTLEEDDFEVLLTMGAGDIGELADKIEKVVRKKIRTL